MMKRILRKLFCKITRLRHKKEKKTILFEGSKFERAAEGLSKSFQCCILNPKWSIHYYIRYLKYGIRCYVRDDWKLEDFYEYNSEGIKSYNSKCKINIARKKTRELFERENIGLIILTEDMLPNNVILLSVAREMHIPSITYMHGLISPNPDFLFGCQTDYFWVWGQYFKDKYIKYKLKNENEIWVAGYPDKIPKQKIKKNEEAILFIGKGYTEWRYPELMGKYGCIPQEIARACVKYGIQFVYRPHPSENMRTVKERFAGTSGVKISREKDLYKDLQHYRYVFGGNSTAMVEAALMNNTVVLIDFKEDIGNDVESYKYYIGGNFFELEACLELIKNHAYRDLPSNQCDSYYVTCDKNYIDNISKEVSRILKESSVNE